MMGKYFWSKLDVQRTHIYVVIENSEYIENTFNEVSLQFSTMEIVAKQAKDKTTRGLSHTP